MRGRWLQFVGLAVVITCSTPAPAAAAPCPSVCARTDTYGFNAAFQVCACGSAPAADCNCVGVCRAPHQGGGFLLYAKNASAVCDSFATDCSVSACTDSTSGSSSTATTTKPPATTSTSTSSTSGSNNNTGSNSNAISTGSKGLETWQIVLIIASSLIVFLVIVACLLSVYCKVRRDLAKSDLHDGGFYVADDATEAMVEQIRPSTWRSSPETATPVGSVPKAALADSGGTSLGASTSTRFSQSYDGARISDMQAGQGQRLSHSPMYEFDGTRGTPVAAAVDGRPRQDSIEL